LPDGGFAVADAGGNDVVRVSPDGAMSTMAVFAPMPATGPDGSEIPMQAVPDAVAVGPQGEVVVGQLTGFPFPPGGASVWTVNADGSTSVLADGFTNIIDLAWGADGTLYVLEWNRGGMMQIDPASPATLEGRLVAIAPDGQEREIASAGLISPGGVAIGPDGALYLTTFSVMEDMGQVIRLQIP
jgi:sugar lactone lactonase YvrE